MIGIIFQFASETIEVRIIGKQCLFRTGSFGGAFASLENLKLSRIGAIKEFPDLKDKENWKEEVIKRFNKKLADMKTEKERAEYVIEDLKKYGYVPLYLQEKGFRIKKL